MAVTVSALSESYYPADQSERVLDTTVGGILHDAAQAVPDQLALIGGHPDPDQRRRWTYGIRPCRTRSLRCPNNPDRQNPAFRLAWRATTGSVARAAAQLARLRTH
jgi:hypothetical protein